MSPAGSSGAPGAPAGRGKANASDIGGVLLPVTTPFDPVTGAVAPVPFRDNLRRWMAEDLAGVVLFGSTGEGVLLDDAEKLRLLEFARDVVPAERLVVAGLAAESTRAAARGASELGLAGADALLVSPPSYFGSALGAEALAGHFLAVADASPVPVLIYHIPKFTHVTLEPGLIGELARHPNIAGLKDSSGDLKRFAAYTEHVPEGFRLLVGSGALLYSALELGAAGGIVALGLLAPAECARILRAFQTGETREAGQLQTRLAPVHAGVVARHGARGVKTALDLLGMAGGPPRAPLLPVAAREAREIGELLRNAGLARAA